MASDGGYKKLRKTIGIYAVVQVALIGLLVYMAVNFQAKLRMIGKEQNFMQGVIATFVIELLLFYPIYRFAAKEVERDLAMLGGLSREEMKEAVKKKRWGDIVKIAVFGFYMIFILAAPAVPLVLSVLYYSFILTILTYLQCYNFAAKKLVKEKESR